MRVPPPEIMLAILRPSGQRVSFEAIDLDAKRGVFRSGGDCPAIVLPPFIAQR